jgi:hypothetical protein
MELEVSTLLTVLLVEHGLGRWWDGSSAPT